MVLSGGQVKKMIVGGQQVEALSGETVEVYNPSTGGVLAIVPRAGAADVDRAVAVAREAFEEGPWATMKPAERGRILYRIAELIRGRAEEVARLESMDNGKPLRQARNDVEVAARYFEFYAGVADKIMGNTIPLGAGFLDFTVREPYGVSAQIVPWNYPIQIGSRGAAPALAAGNTVVLKPSIEAPMTALAVAEIGLEAGLPPGVFNVITGTGGEAGARLAGHPDINQLTFTGSVEVGVDVAKRAAENVVPVALELGGKSPNVVFADADLDLTIAGVSNAIFQNAGQTCSAGSRLLVERRAHDQVVELLARRVRGMRLGPGVDDPDMGPLISERQRQRVLEYVKVGRDEGARVVAGGRAPEDPKLRTGYFVEPTLLDQVGPQARVAQEEIFGPVLSIIPFDDPEEALRIANRSQYGLVAGVWTRDIDKALSIATKIKSGQVYVNTYGAGGGVELPFGGYKKSGFGREKGLEALLTYTQVKNVCIKFG